MVYGMKKWRAYISPVLGLALLFSLLGGGCAKESPDQLKVVTTTALISQVVERVSGAKVTVANIIPPAQCPGHFDVKPGDVQKLADADLFIMHNWQGEKFSVDLIASADNQSLVVFTVDISGNWMVPPVQREATDKIAAALSQNDPANSATYLAAAAEYQTQIASEETRVRLKLGEVDLTRVSVLCNDQQAGFLKWAGLNVVGTYGEADSLTPQTVKDLEDKGRSAGVVLIVDNLQNGADTGKGLAADLNVTKITLSNFPGGFDGTETWEKALDKNIDLLVSAVKA
jgi:zinc transport system substrate-binding protein